MRDSFQYKECVIFHCYVMVRADRKRRIIISIVIACLHTTVCSAKSVKVKQMIHLFSCIYSFVSCMLLVSVQKGLLFEHYSLCHTLSGRSTNNSITTAVLFEDYNSHTAVSLIELGHLWKWIKDKVKKTNQRKDGLLTNYSTTTSESNKSLGRKLWKV